MKPTLNILNTLLFAALALSGLLWLSYKIMDAMKVNTDLPEPEKTTFKTVYPDDMPQNFNEWSNYIHKQLN